MRQIIDALLVKAQAYQLAGFTDLARRCVSEAARLQEQQKKAVAELMKGEESK